MSDAVLLVIDAQESFRHRPYFVEDELKAYLPAQQALIDGAKSAGIPVVQIFHDDGDGPFSEESGYIRPIEGLSIKPDVTFRKARHSALIGSGLDVWLVANGIRRIIISGIRTEQCCETTTRHASDLGYEVDYVTEATLTFPMTAADGKNYTSADIKARSELVLAGRFARITTVAEALAGHAQKKAA